MFAQGLFDSNTLFRETPTVSVQDSTDYPEFAQDMAKWGYTWDAHKVETDDGFVLTTFHVTGKVNEHVQTDNERAPILLMHGQGCDAESWVYVDPDTPIP